MHLPVKRLLVIRRAEPVTEEFAGNSEVVGSIPTSGLNTHDSKVEYLIDIQDTTGRYRLGVLITDFRPG